MKNQLPDGPRGTLVTIIYNTDDPRNEEEFRRDILVDAGRTQVKQLSETSFSVKGVVLQFPTARIEKFEEIYL
jgi:hypothetical protein